MTRNIIYIIFALVSLTLAGCSDKQDTYSITIDIPTSIANNMKSKKHLVFMSDHFNRTAQPIYEKISGDKVVFKDIQRTSQDNLIDITIGNYTFQLVPDTIGDISIKFVDSYKYIVEKGSEETYFISIYNNYYHDTRKKLEKYMNDPKELESICEAYKTYTDSILKRTPFSQWAYLHVAEQNGTITIYDFDKNIDDRKILYRVTQAWKARNSESEQYRLLQKMTEPIPVELKNGVPYSEQSTFINITLPDANGNMRSLKDLEGKNVVLLFCSARIMGEQELNRIKYYYETNKDVEIYHVNFDKDEKEFRKIAKKYPWIMVNDPSFQSGITYQVNEVPTTFLFNKRGNFVGKNIDFVGFKF